MPPFTAPPLGRRAFLGALVALAATPALVATSEAEAAKPPSKVRRIEPTPMGVTLELGLDHAPFPCKGAPYDDRTVLAFVPSHYRAPANKRLDVIVHFHGHNTTAVKAIAVHKLREQLRESKQNAILVVPQGPVNAPDSHPGKLDREGGLRRLLEEVAATLASKAARAALSDSAVPRGAKLGTVCLSAHSGGYRSAAACLRRGGLEIREVYLFDALYGEVDAFRDWVVARKGKAGRGRHKLISYAGPGEVRQQNQELEQALQGAGIHCLHERTPGELSRVELTRGRAIFIDTPLAHVAVTYEQNAFRDCLFASSLHRALKSDWFQSKHDPRPLDRRPPS